MQCKWSGKALISQLIYIDKIFGVGSCNSEVILDNRQFISTSQIKAYGYLLVMKPQVPLSP